MAVNTEHLRVHVGTATNDLGTAGSTWSLSTYSFAIDRLYARTAKDVICIAIDEGTSSNDSTSDPSPGRAAAARTHHIPDATETPWTRRCC